MRHIGTKFQEFSQGVHQGIEIALKKQNGGHAVHRAGFPVHADAAVAQQPVSFGAGEALIPELNLNACIFGDAGGVVMHPLSLRAHRSAHIKRVADKNEIDALFAGDLGDSCHICPFVHAVKRLQTLGRKPQFVTDGDADAPLAKIQSQYPHDKFDSILTQRVKAVASPAEGQSTFNLSVFIIAGGVVMAALYYGRVFLIMCVTAVIIAFLLDPFVHLLVKFRFPRSLAALVVCLAAALVLYAVGMAVYIQTAGLVEQLPQITQRAASLVDQTRTKVEKFETSAYKLISRQQPPAAIPLPVVTPRRRSSSPPPQVIAPPAIQEVRIHQDYNPIADFVYPRLGSLYEFLLMASFVPFLVYFLLSWGSHANRAFLQFFTGEDRVIAKKSLQGIGDMVRAFVVGNSLLGVLLAFTSTVAFWAVSVPFPLLAGPSSGFLSLIPYVGLPLAMVPPILASLSGGGSFSGVLIVAALVAGLHLIALNLLYPKIVGARVHLNPLVVTFALMFWSFLWDAAGLLLAIPMTAALKAVCDNVRVLRPIGRFLGD
jgi:predicted PurR-regulated permease PerM